MSKQSDTALFLSNDFRIYLRSWAKARGRGEFKKIAEALRIHTTLVSQILNGRKCLTEEQAARLTKYMRLNTLETDYFLKLIQIERAGSAELKEVYERHLKNLRSQASEVKSRVPDSTEMNEQDRAIFYSSWQFAAVRLMTDIAEFQTIEKIALRLQLPVSRVQEILSFLVSRNLCRESRGRFIRTNKNTHIEASSTLSIRHHLNWRSKSMGLIEHISSDDLTFTAPVSIAKKDIPIVREALLNVISNVAKIIEESKPEEVVYLGIDWIKM